MGIVSGAVAAYLIGCAPSSRIASRLVKNPAWTAWAGRLADLAKGYLALSLFGPVGSTGQALTLAAVVAGDQWPAMGREIGREGMWTGLGGLVGLTPVAPLVWAAFWGVGFAATGYFAMARITAMLALPLALGLTAGWPLGLAAIPACILMLERQRRPLRSVLRGEQLKHHWRPQS